MAAGNARASAQDGARQAQNKNSLRVHACAGLQRPRGRVASRVATTHKEILTKANEAIARGDFEGFLIHCTEDTVWNFLGERTLRGKEEVRRWMAETYREPPTFKVRQLIADGDFLVALGEITLKDANGNETENSYCDVWRFENNRLAELKAFVIAAV